MKLNIITKIFLISYAVDRIINKSGSFADILAILLIAFMLEVIIRGVNYKELKKLWRSLD